MLVSLAVVIRNRNSRILSYYWLLISVQAFDVVRHCNPTDHIRTRRPMPLTPI